MTIYNTVVVTERRPVVTSNDLGIQPGLLSDAFCSAVHYALAPAIEAVVAFQNPGYTPIKTVSIPTNLMKVFSDIVFRTILNEETRSGIQATTNWHEQIENIITGCIQYNGKSTETNEIRVTEKRAQVTSRDLGLEIELDEELCSAVYHALAPAVEAVIALQNAGETYKGYQAVYLTDALKSVFSGIVDGAVIREVNRSGIDPTDGWHDHMEQIITGCINAERQTLVQKTPTICYIR